ncbi:MAG TPA: UDP-N-acetylmuramoyl-L-alanyl-D-glutamate--2,6-diaminopimelate ligase [Mycobacteriales bacterium]|nr:UDP-N-acetylmuramoyl-L-alanyl-D-glutamate--2,6-diaminopimelate ligase [Mycobacteriales bacterium]
MTAGSLTAVRVRLPARGAHELSTVLRPRQTVARPLTGVHALVPGAVLEGDPAGVEVTGVTHDSRAVRPGDLYAALPGSTVHGADFIGRAAAAGAVAVLTDRPGPHPLPTVVVADPRRHLGPVSAWVYDDPSRSLEVVGITGTNGKTTSAYLVEAGFRAAGQRTGLIGTVETRVGDEVLESAHTTPEAPDLHALLAVMRERDVTGVAMEVSSHGLALGRVDGVRYAAAVFTNLSQDHLDFHGDMEEYFKAKAALFDESRSAVAVVNVDDAAGRRLLDRVRIPLVMTSARGSHTADWRATDVTATAEGTSFRLHGPGLTEPLPVSLRIPGRFNVDNVLGAVAALHAVGVDTATAVAGMAALPGVPGRLERVDVGQEFLALVDYAHTPEAVASVLAVLRPLTPGRLIVVLGCGGDRDRSKRPLMGAAAARGADVVVVTSDNPRSEDPLAIVAVVELGAREVRSADVVVEPDRSAAIALACASARSGDTVLVAGKGHEQGQVLADRTIPFDDREVLAHHLAAAVSP